MTMMREHIASLGTDPDTVPQLYVPNQNEEKMFDARLLANLTKDLTPLVTRKAWFLYRVPANHPLYISDNPVALHNDHEFELRGNLGLAVFGVQVYLPVSAHRCLAMYCPDEMAHLEAAYEDYLKRIREDAEPKPPPIPEAGPRLIEGLRTGMCMDLPEPSLDFVNSLQVWNAERYVYCSADDFDLAREMIAKEPRLRTGPRSELA
jgi:hypothetical protein